MIKNNVPATLSQALQNTLAELAGESVTLQEISYQLGTRAYGAFIILLTVPNFIPGLSLLSGMFLLLFSIQMAMGIERPWLPKFIGNICIKKATLNNALNWALPHLAVIEHYIRPRIIILSKQMAIRLIGIVIAFLSFLLLIPIPFSNFIPTIALLFIAFGILQKDGLVTLISILLGLFYCAGFLWLAWVLILRLITAV